MAGYRSFAGDDLERVFYFRDGNCLNPHTRNNLNQVLTEWCWKAGVMFYDVPNMRRKEYLDRLVEDINRLRSRLDLPTIERPVGLLTEDFKKWLLPILKEMDERIYGDRKERGNCNQAV